MDDKERRKIPRVQIYDPVSYSSLGPDGKKLQHNIAVVRDVSKTGIRIETQQPIRSSHIALMFFELNEVQVEVKGRVVYCKQNAHGQYNVGVNLAGTSFENRLFVKALVKSYHYLKGKSPVREAPGIQS